MVITFSKKFSSVQLSRAAVLLGSLCLTGNAFAQATGFGLDGLCFIAQNFKLTIGICAIIGVMCGAVFALLKKGDLLMDTVMGVVIVCGVVAIAVTMITKMGLTINCAV